MERRTKVELFEEIRREYEFGIGTVRGVAHKLGVHRRMVRQALKDARPPARKRAQRRRPVIEYVIPFIESILEGDRQAPRKQRHTAHRIWQRIQTEMPELRVAESTIRRYVRERKRELGWSALATCVPQAYGPGQEAQVDWYEAWAELSGEQVRLQVFAMRSMASGAAFHRAYRHATQPAFLEAHEYAFGYFGGVFRTLRYDNLKAAVKKILRGYRREETARFIAFRSHWRFHSEFCTPEEPHEKGGVEGEVGYFRRNHWVPLPQAHDLEELNVQLLAACHADEQRQIAGPNQAVGTAALAERAHLLPLAEQGFELAEVSFPRVDGLGCVRVRTNLYSVPAAPGRTLEVRLGPSHLELRDEGRCLARHERCYGRQQQILELEHYLEVLERKPGALAGSKALARWRAKGWWPASYDRLLDELIERHGKPSGTRQMIQVLALVRPHGHEQLRAAIEQALLLGCYDAAAIRHLITAADLARARSEIIELGALSGFEHDDGLRRAAEPGGGVMSGHAAALEEATIKQQCKVLRMPAVAAQCAQLATEAVRDRRTHLSFLEALLAAELEERECNLIERRLREARLPRLKTLEDFDFAQCPKVSAVQIHELAQGAYIERAEPIIFIGDSGTGKTHLLTGLAVAACRQKRRVRFTTAAGLVNELVEAKHQLQLGRVLARWARYDLIALDEVGYVPLAEVGAEFLFQVVAERAEKAAVILTTNLPFSEWTQVIPNARLCKALVDRITDRAHVVETGVESYRFRRTLEKRKIRNPKEQ